MTTKTLSFQFEKPFDDVKIGDSNYELYYDDASLKLYQKQALKYQKEVEKYIKIQENIEKMTDEEISELEQQGMKFVKGFVETFYGKDSYEKLYEESGKAMINFMPLIRFTLEWLDSKIPESNNKKDYYTKRKGK